MLFKEFDDKKEYVIKVDSIIELEFILVEVIDIFTGKIVGVVFVKVRGSLKVFGRNTTVFKVANF
jgi:hypothetical protein